MRSADRKELLHSSTTFIPTFMILEKLAVMGKLPKNVDDKIDRQELKKTLDQSVLPERAIAPII